MTETITDFQRGLRKPTPFNQVNWNSDTQRNKLQGDSLEQAIKYTIENSSRIKNNSGHQQRIRQIISNFKKDPSPLYKILIPFFNNNKPMTKDGCGLNIVWEDNIEPGNIKSWWKIEKKDVGLKICKNKDCYVGTRDSIFNFKRVGKCQHCGSGLKKHKVKSVGEEPALIIHNASQKGIIKLLINRGYIKEINSEKILSKTVDSLYYLDGEMYIVEATDRSRSSLHKNKIRDSLIYPIILKTYAEKTYKCNFLKIIKKGDIHDSVTGYLDNVKQSHQITVSIIDCEEWFKEHPTKDGKIVVGVIGDYNGKCYDWAIIVDIPQWSFKAYILKKNSVPDFSSKKEHIEEHMYGSHKMDPLMAELKEDEDD